MRPATGSAPPLATRALTKDYGSGPVVRGVSLDVHAGTIHALLGENGAGKSTLITMAVGALEPTSGEVLVDGSPTALRSVRAAQDAGIAALPQELTLVPTLGAAENILLGLRRPGSRLLRRRGDEARRAAELLATLGQSLPSDVPVRELSAVQQTMVALARALARDARVLILDEPTAALTDTETAQLFRVLRTLRDSGTAILYISHRLAEVFALADTVTVLRNGALVWTKPVAATGTDDVVAAMTGRADPGAGASVAARTDSAAPAVVRTEGTAAPDDALAAAVERMADAGDATEDATAAAAPVEAHPVALRARGLTGARVRDVDLELRAGRILGIAGLAGAGRSELLGLLAGARRPSAGTVHLDGADVTRRSLGARLRAGIALVPEERRSQGLVLADSVERNIALADLPGLSAAGVLRPARERAAARRHMTDLRIVATSVRQPVTQLSGGNQQKVVLAKFLQTAPRVLLLDEPTRGIDVGTKGEIYQLVRRLAGARVAVVVVSSEIPELLGLADEIAVLHEGRLTGPVPGAGATENSILHLCYGRPA